MKGDFSRDSYDSSRHAYRVLMQQGRVQLDADWNEQASIVLHRLETVVRDVFGTFGGPEDHCGFALYSTSETEDGDFHIGAGRYYVDGMLIESHRPQRYVERDAERLASGHAYIVYLDVWEEFVAPAQDPALIDPALEGLDTTARTRLEWRVRAHRVSELPTKDDISGEWPHKFLKPELLAPRGRLAASVATQPDPSDPALGAVRMGYHGTQNRLYRVEIHDPGTAPGGATFKWSRDNGAVAFAIRSVSDKTIALETFGRDSHGTLASGDWVEICDDDDAGAQKPARSLFAVAHGDPTARTIALKTASGYAFDAAKHPVLRRWDQRSSPLPVIETSDDDEPWTELEDGIVIRFAPAAASDSEPVYRTGDYWMIPARTADDGILLWPLEPTSGNAAFRAPAGIRHRYAPLGGIVISSAGKMTIDRDLHDYRKTFRALMSPA